MLVAIGVDILVVLLRAIDAIRDMLQEDLGRDELGADITLKRFGVFNHLFVSAQFVVFIFENLASHLHLINSSRKIFVGFKELFFALRIIVVEVFYF